MTRRPLIGFTAEIDELDGTQPALAYRRGAAIFDVLAEAGCAPVMFPHLPSCIDAFLDGCDGIIVGGGGYQFRHERLFGPDGPYPDEPAHKVRRAAFEIALVKAALRRNLPLLGICGGFQVLNAVLGGELTVALAAADPALAVHAGDMPPRIVHAVDVAPDTLLHSILGETRIHVNSLHRQGVLVGQAAGRVGATSPDGVVEAIEVADRRFALGVQWHPEAPVSDADWRLLRGFAAACTGQDRLSGDMLVP